MRALVLTTFWFFSGCSAAGANALLGTAVGATVAGVRRSNGECYTPCNPGHTCNPQSGFCEPVPCRGACLQHEQCEQSPLGERCVPAATATLELRSVEVAPTLTADAGTPRAPVNPPSPRLLPTPKE